MTEMRGTRLKANWICGELCAARVTQNGEAEVRRLLSDNVISLYKSTVNFQEKHVETQMDCYIITSNKTSMPLGNKCRSPDTKLSILLT
jgi:hypothetical protein